mmetsp:Transcript_10032/g.28312  ORF Transcript_10032/g.28312 Transcript_10032/m.28312 type:complete len:306 (+) Transcript_10032:79-996(+)
MLKLKTWMLWVLSRHSAALRRGPPDVVDFASDDLGKAMHDFHNLRAFFSQGDVEEILEELKNVTVSFWSTWGNLTLPTGKDLPRAVPRRCAIVASGDSVLNAEAGQDIDAVDGPVLRMNFARTKRYEAFVGNRTDALLINDQVPCKWKRTSSGPPPAVKMVVINNFGLRRGVACVQYIQEAFPDVPFFVLDFPKMNSGLMKLENRVVETGPFSLRRLASTMKSTSGIIGGLFLMNLCKEVLHYGFLESPSCRKHYWEKRRSNCSVDKAHNLTKEHVLWKVISSTQGVNFTGEGIVYGWPRLQAKA